MEAQLMKMPAKYKPSVTDPGVPGNLVLSENDFVFTPSDPTLSTNMKLHVQFRNIQGQKFSKHGSKQALLNLIRDPSAKRAGFIFEFDSFESRDVCRDLVGEILRNNQNVCQLTKAEAELTKKLLQKDSDLRKLYTELVTENILTEPEFWTTRKHLLDEAVSTRQRKGLKSVMLTDFSPVQDGQSNKVTFHLAPESIHQIFAEKPAVRRAYLMNVPFKMKEIEFWNKYCRSEYLYRTDNLAAAKAEAADDEVLAQFLDDESLVHEARRKIRKVDPAVDMAHNYADDYSHLSGHGTAQDSGRERIDEDANQSKRTLVRDINRHAAVVLEGQALSDCDFGNTRTVAEALERTEQDNAEVAAATVDNLSDERCKDGFHEMSKIEDLQATQTDPYASLCIRDHRKYFSSQQASPMHAQSDRRYLGKAEHFNPDEIYGSLAYALLGIRESGLKDPILNAESAVKAQNNLSQFISSTKYHNGKKAQKDVCSNLPKQEQDKLREQWKTIQEMLCQFWACCLVNSTFVSNKIRRLKDAMAQKYDNLQSAKASTKVEYRHEISLLIHPMLQALDAAFENNEVDSRKRSSKISEKAAGFT